MCRIINRKTRAHIAVALLLCTLLFSSLKMANANANELVPQALLGPLFAGLYDIDYVRSVSKQCRDYNDEYGSLFWQWPYAVREDLSRRVEPIGNLPEGILYSRTPTIGDVDEELLAAKAWIELTHAFPTAEEGKAWYEDSYTVVYGTKDLQTSWWWVTFLPYKVLSVNTAAKLVAYTVQLDDLWNVAGVFEYALRGRGDDTVESTNPLDAFAGYLYGILREVAKPKREWGDMEKLDMNISFMFPHIKGFHVVFGMPTQEHISRDTAILISKQYISQELGYDASEQDALFTDASFQIRCDLDGEFFPDYDWSSTIKVQSLSQGNDILREAK